MVSLCLLLLELRKEAAPLQSVATDNEGFLFAGGTLRLWGFDFPYRIFMSPRRSGHRPDTPDMFNSAAPYHTSRTTRSTDDMGYLVPTSMYTRRLIFCRRLKYYRCSIWSAVFTSLFSQ